MKVHRREDVNLLPASLDEAWSFFANPLNLDKLTPERMAFRNVYPLDAHSVYPGMLIVHEVAPLPLIKLTWVTEITHVEPQRRFVDEQRKGPFAMWHHIHEFEQVNDGVIVKDILYYGLPFGFLGRLAGKLQIHKQIDEIFRFRGEALQNIFTSRS